MSPPAEPRWWEMRRAQNRKPSTYRCPLCGNLLPALSEHMLMLPEGRPAGRRHAHTECVMRARRDGRLPTRDEWRRSEATAAGPGADPRDERPRAAWARLRALLRRPRSSR